MASRAAAAGACSCTNSRTARPRISPASCSRSSARRNSRTLAAANSPCPAPPAACSAGRRPFPGRRLSPGSRARTVSCGPRRRRRRGPRAIPRQPRRRTGRRCGQPVHRRQPARARVRRCAGRWEQHRRRALAGHRAGGAQSIGYLVQPGGGGIYLPCPLGVHFRGQLL